MTKFLPFAVLMVALPLGVAAQDKTKSSGDNAAPVVIDKPRLPQGWRALGLSDKQKKDVLTLRAKYAVKKKALLQQLKALKAEEKVELPKLLTEDQRQRLKK